MSNRNRIRIMPAGLAIKIAAGEVIERPASVVKELVENSIDARATDISVHVQDGGRKLIKVVDNGEGMTRDDAVVAFERHATSKLLQEEDLYSISTMGFRGEALPSIAAVSEIHLTTKVSGEIAGTRVSVKGGKIEDIAEAGSAGGTSVEVRNIFFNTPARLKFMRSQATETGHISDTATRLALSYPNIRFRLYSNNALLLDTSAKADLKIRIADIFGREILKDVIPVEAGDETNKVHGFIAKPEIAYSTAKGLFIYVNGRWIRDRGVNHAIACGYRNCLAAGKYPFVVLFMTIPPQHVDVNVHPAKSEVRFKNQRDVYDLVKNAVESALAPSYVSFVKSYEEQRGKGQGAGGREIAGLAQEVHEGAVDYTQFQRDFYGGQSSEPQSALHESQITNRASNSRELFFNELKIIGQLWSEYLLCQRQDEFYIIDQHAAAERVAFEKLKKDYYVNHRIPTQMLLMPQTLELALQEQEAAEAMLPALRQMGFDMEPFGGNAFIIRAVPDMLSGIDCRGLVSELLNELASVGISFKVEGSLDEILMRVACHSVIRGRRPLADEEAMALLKNLSRIDFSGNCPHGRPVIKAITRFEIEKMFHRK